MRTPRVPTISVDRELRAFTCRELKLPLYAQAGIPELLDHAANTNGLAATPQ